MKPEILSDLAAAQALHGIIGRPPTVKPGTPVPVAWCVVHEAHTPDDEVRQDKHGHSWCGREAEDEFDRRCHMVALVTGDDL